MKDEFWLERWQAGRTAFHLEQVNPLLRDHWPGQAACTERGRPGANARGFQKFAAFHGCPPCPGAGHQISYIFSDSG